MHDDPRMTGTDWVVTHYEAVVGDPLYYLGVRWSTIIVDEAHRIKNKDAQRTKAIKSLGAYRRIALTGTPMEKSPADLWSILNWLYPSQFRSYWGFFNEYVDFDMHPAGFRMIKGGQNLESLGRVLKPFTLRRTKFEVRDELPELLKQDVLVDMEPMQRALYDEIRKSRDILVTLKDLDGSDRQLVIKNALGKFLRLHQAATDPKLLGDPGRCPSAKIEWTLDYIHDNPYEKFVVFTSYHNTAIRLYEMLGASIVVGGLGKGVTDKEIADFRSGKRRTLVGTIAGLGEGVDLPEATTAIFVDSTWSTILMNQAADRIHRLGQDVETPRSVIYLHAANTVDLLVASALERKWTEAELVYAFLREAEIG
jgi:SNF2 family DNA or RNA helicase